jgi:hypothetical protein
MTVQSLRDSLGPDWTDRDLAEVTNVHKSNATRRRKRLMAAEIVEKVTDGKTRAARTSGTIPVC